MSLVTRAAISSSRAIRAGRLQSLQKHSLNASWRSYASEAESVKPIESFAQFKEILKTSENPVVIDFWATWCGPCRAISPIFSQLSALPEFAGKVDFYKVDVDEQPEIAQEVQVRAMPTFMAFEDGRKVNELVGANPAGLQTLLQSVL